MKRILCYGDSNTWGFVPGSFVESSFAFDRYDERTRWTGVLAKALGSEYTVIEEGLNSRNTGIDDPFGPPGVILNGYKTLMTTLLSHAPLDVVIFMLGTNDTKNYFSANANMIAKSMRRLVMTTKAIVPAEKILVIAPPVHAGVSSAYGGIFDETSQQKSMQLASLYQTLCQYENCQFLNASDVAEFSTKDSIHLDEVGHRLLGLSVAKELPQLSV